MPDVLDLEGTADALLAGQISLQAAEARIQSWRARYAFPFEPGEDPQAVLDRREQLAAALKAFTMRLLADEQPLRVYDLGWLAATAGRLLNADAELLARVSVAIRLSEVQRPKLAWELQKDAAELAARAGGDWPLVVTCLAADLLQELGRLEESIAQASSAVEAALTRGRVECELFATQVRSLARSRLGRHEEALADSARAVELAPQVEGRPPQPMVLLDIPGAAEVHFLRGMVARAAGAYETALAAWERARELFFADGNPRGAAFALSETGILWELLGDAERGQEILGRAAAEADGLGMRSASRRWTKRFDDSPVGDDRPSDLLARAHALATADPPQHADARQLYLECIRAVRDLGPDRIEVLARTGLAASYGNEGRLDEALAASRAAARTARRLGDAALEVISLSNLGRTLAVLGRNTEAQETLREASAIGERLRREAATTEVRQAIAAALASAYEVLAVLSATDWVRPDGSIGRRRSGADVHEIGERLRAANLTWWLAMGTAVEEGRHAGLWDGFLALRAAEIELERSALAGGQLGAALEERSRRWRELQAVAAAASVTLPERPSPAGAGDLARSLRPPIAIVDLLSLHEGVTLTVTAGDGEPQCLLVRWTRPQRLDFLARWQRCLQRTLGEQGSRGVARRGWRPRDALAGAVGNDAGATLDALLAELDERLLAPMASLLPESARSGRILLVPHRELLVLPFSRLERHLPGVPLSLVPGLGAASRLLARARSPEGGERLAVGDATGELTFAQRELEWLPGFRSVPPRAAEIVDQAPAAAFLHFAGHGLFDEEDPYLSGLTVSRDASGGAGFDLLSVRDIFGRLRLPRCYLVVLSACCTGLPRHHPSSEFTGLPASFLVAGARNVVASLWPADDAATALLMAEFYEALAVSDGSPSVALHRARARLAQLPREDAVRRLGAEWAVPEGDPPFASPEFTLCFQHYGVD